jgi:hypothetical protein
LRVQNLHIDAKVKRKILIKHAVKPDEAERAFRDSNRRVIGGQRLVVRGKDEISGKYIVIVGNLRKGVLHAATCRQMTAREKASYRKKSKRGQV